MEMTFLILQFKLNLGLKLLLI